MSAPLDLAAIKAHRSADASLDVDQLDALISQAERHQEVERSAAAFLTAYESSSASWGDVKEAEQRLRAALGETPPAGGQVRGHAVPAGARVLSEAEATRIERPRHAPWKCSEPLALMVSDTYDLTGPVEDGLLIDLAARMLATLYRKGYALIQTLPAETSGARS